MRGVSSDGKSISPGRISIGLLAGFMENFRNLVQDDASEASIEEGSFKIVALLPLLIWNSLQNDLEYIGQGRYESVSSPKRVQAVKNFQKQAGKYLVEFDFAMHENTPLLTISKEKPLPPERQTWFPMSATLEGEIIELGGKAPNLHIEMDGEKIKVDVTKQQVQEIKENLVYQTRRLGVSYRWNPQTDEKKDFVLQEIIERPKLDQKKLQKLIEQGTKDWADVPDATAWVEEMRGGYES